MDQTYTYILADFTSSNGAVDILSLQGEIEISSITVALVISPIVIGFADVKITFKDPISGPEKTILDTVVGAHKGIPSDLAEFTKDVEGNVLVAPHLPSGFDGRFVSHNFCDPSTWWQESLEALADITVPDGGFIEYALPQGIIDLRHGRLTDENNITDETTAPNGTVMTSIIPVVYIDASPIDQSNEDADAGNDRYTIDYALGKIIFAIARDPAEDITVDCRFPTSSLFRFIPPVGKKWTFELAEIDLSSDIDLSSPVTSSLWGSNPDLPPNGSFGTLVPLGSRVYKNTKDLHSYANDFVGPLPAALGGSGATGVEAWTFKWVYTRATIMYNSLVALGAGVWTINEARIQIIGDQPLGGSYLAITYHSSQDPE